MAAWKKASKLPGLFELHGIEVEPPTTRSWVKEHKWPKNGSTRDSAFGAPAGPDLTSRASRSFFEEFALVQEKKPRKKNLLGPKASPGRTNEGRNRHEQMSCRLVNMTTRGKEARQPPRVVGQRKQTVQQRRAQETRAVLLSIAALRTKKIKVRHDERWSFYDDFCK